MYNNTNLHCRWCGRDIKKVVINVVDENLIKTMNEHQPNSYIDPTLFFAL